MYSSILQGNTSISTNNRSFDYFLKPTYNVVSLCTSCINRYVHCDRNCILYVVLITKKEKETMEKYFMFTWAEEKFLLPLTCTTNTELSEHTISLQRLSNFVNFSGMFLHVLPFLPFFTFQKLTWHHHNCMKMPQTLFSSQEMVKGGDSIQS